MLNSIPYLKWKNKGSDLYGSAAPSLLEREKEGEATTSLRSPYFSNILSLNFWYKNESTNNKAPMMM
jgi:hypothetical protein